MLQKRFESFVMFTFLTIFLILVSKIRGKYAFVHVTDTHVGEDGSTENLNKFVDVKNSINSKITEYNIKFVLITGDLSDRSKPEEFAAFKSVADQLRVMYIPLIGNHDIYLYDGKTKETKPTGDIRFFQMFKSKFSTTLPLAKFYHVSGGYKVFDPTLLIDSYYQNFVFEYDNTVFIGLDWNERENDPLLKGPKPRANLHDFNNGTYYWFKNVISEMASRQGTINQLILVQHHPFNCPLFTPCSTFSFKSADVKLVRQVFIDESFPMNKVFGDVCGHTHKWKDYSYWNSQREWHSIATKKEACYAVFEVEDDGKISTITRICAEPTPPASKISDPLIPFYISVGSVTFVLFLASLVVVFVALIYSLTKRKRREILKEDIDI